MKVLFFAFLTTLAIAGFGVQSFAARPDKCGTWPNCPDGEPDRGTDTLHNVLIEGIVKGTGTNWLNSGHGKLDFKNFRDGSDGFLNLDFFRNLFGNDIDNTSGARCFAESGPLYAAILSKVKANSADGMFWFWGYTNHNEGSPERKRVLYVLHLDGDFLPNYSKTWIEEHLKYSMSLVNWELGLANEGNEVKNRSCFGEGSFNNEVVVTTSPS